MTTVSVVAPVRRFARIEGPLAERGARHGSIIAGLYYFLFNPPFRTEQKAFLSGTTGYRRSITAPEGNGNSQTERTSTGKGPPYASSTDPFALNYSGETVEAFVTSPQCDSGAVD